MPEVKVTSDEFTDKERGLIRIAIEFLINYVEETGQRFEEAVNLGEDTEEGHQVILQQFHTITRKL